MLTPFNRRELVTLVSMEKLIAVKEALSGAGISCQVKTSNIGAFTAGRQHGIPFINPDASYTYRIYVHKKDFHRASEAIQSALRGS